MDPAITTTLTEQAPWAAVVLLLILAFLQYMGKQEDKRLAHDKEQETSRILAAKEREQDRREHEMAIANMQAQNMKALIDSIEATMKAVADTIADHEKASRERYEKMNITNDLLTVAKSQLGKQKR